MSFDVQMHNNTPAVCIKVPNPLTEKDLPKELDEGFDLTWLQEHMTADELEDWRAICAQDAVELLRQEGLELLGPFGRKVEIFWAGRSGGWLEVAGLPDLADWSVDLRTAWRQFEQLCDDSVESFWAAVLYNIYINVWESAKEEEKERTDLWDEVSVFLSNNLHCNPDSALKEFKFHCPKIVERVEGK